MRSYIQISASATPGDPFSNSTEGSAWTARWCDQCAHDRGAPDDGCMILLVGLTGKTPAEWLPNDKMRLGERYRCTEFRRGKRPEPAPQQVPGQLALFHEGNTP